MTAALIFDLDGTLADSMPLHYTVWCRVLEPHGLDFPEARFYRMGGVPTAKIIKILSSEQDIDVDVETLAAQKYDLYFDLLHTLQPIDTIVQIARKHHGTLPMAIASGGRRIAVQRTIEQLKIGELFDVLVTADDVTHHKPHPETFLNAAKLLDVPPEDCRVYEDADPGIEAARTAGMEVIDVRELLAAI